eukprot:scaffold2275_cov245-Pinguiococcus_pyrenoidosus.AAC.5
MAPLPRQQLLAYYLDICMTGGCLSSRPSPATQADDQRFISISTSPTYPGPAIAMPSPRRLVQEDGLRQLLPAKR